jgi:hypothetical protein
LAMVVTALKQPQKIGVALVGEEGSAVTVKEGTMSDYHFISPEADPETFRMVGALGEMLFAQARKSFGVDSLLVIAQNADFKIVMFPRNDGFVVWKTNLTTDEIIRELDQSGGNRRKSTRSI